MTDAPAAPGAADTAVVGLDGAPWPRESAPRNLDAERALLDAVFIDNRTRDAVAGIVAGADFHAPVHGRIFETALELYRQGGEANPVTLRHMFEDDADLAGAGGAAYLARLARAAVTVGNAAHYARMINELAVRRAALGLQHRWAHAMAGSRVDAFSASALLAGMRARLDALEARLPAQGRAATLGQAARDAGARIEDAWRKDGALPGVTTGLVDLDSQLGGFQAPDLVVLAGRPGMGKTALALGMALAAAGAGVRGAVFSLEMSVAQLGLRAIAAETGIPAERLHRGAVRQRDFERIVAAGKALAALPLHIDDSAGLTVERIGAAARRLKRQGLGFAVGSTTWATSARRRRWKARPGYSRSPMSPAPSRRSPRTSRSRCWRSASSAAPSTRATTSGPSSRTCAIPARSSRTPISCSRSTATPTTWPRRSPTRPGPRTTPGPERWRA